MIFGFFLISETVCGEPVEEQRIQNLRFSERILNLSDEFMNKSGKSRNCAQLELVILYNLSILT